MAKKSADSKDSSVSGTSAEGLLPAQRNLRAIPPVDRILGSSAYAGLLAEFGRMAVKEALTAYLGALRRAGDLFSLDASAAELRSVLAATWSSTLRPVINASGVLIHTNLGRSPIDPRIWSEAKEIVAGYSNLEFDLEAGERGARDEHLSELAASLFGCEAAILTNNNAAGTLLLLAAVASGGEVLVSRGELVEIGGSFRVPDVIQQGGAKLKEVGTTNRTRAGDYAAAAGRRTAAILRVHRSNFEIVGFTERPEIAELVEVARTKKLPLLYDEGSGRVVDLASYGFARGETLRELIAAGVDVVTCSTDKLIGATQGGLLLGRKAIIERCRRHPLMRALRAGKESYAIVAATLRAFASGRQEELVPIYRMLATPIHELRARAVAMVSGSDASVVAVESVLGGGTTPTETIPSIAVEIPGNATELAKRFLARDLPIVGRIADDRFLLDLRTVQSDELEMVRRALAEASRG
jgi:L-seryl-tRNA(Ser) seleniumtransferase